MNLDKIQNEKLRQNDGLVLLAMRMNFLTKSWARCNNGNGNEFVFSQELDK